MLSFAVDTPDILDIGCGPGEATTELARMSKGTVTGLDNHEIGHFALPDEAWWNYYTPLEDHFSTLRKKYRNDPAALGILENEEQEISLYRGYKDWYGYVFYIMRKGPEAIER